MRRPNVIYVFADEWRAQATGYNGDVNCQTPVLDRLAAESLDLTQAVAGMPVCCPYRASLLTGQYPLTHGVFINDVELRPDCDSIARAFGRGGYRTTWIGKWHVYGSPDGHYGRRKAFVPRSHQMGFDDWYGFECCHDYNDSHYFHNDDPTPRRWEGYDAVSQTDLACRLIRERAGSDQPQALFLSWGPPHFPLHTAPEQYRQRYADREIVLRPNVPPELRAQAQDELRGYYAHIAALDDCLAKLLAAIDASGQAQDTILVVTADHGDMRQCQALDTKLFPWDESVCVPYLLRWPRLHGTAGRKLAVPIDAPDQMPTLLGLCGLSCPAAAQGRDWSPVLRGEMSLQGDEMALMGIHAEFTELCNRGLRAWRGLRGERWCYVRDIRGPWLLYERVADPYQLRNLIDSPDHARIRAELDAELWRRLAAVGDEFLDGRTYIDRYGYGHYKEVNLPVTRQWRDPWVAASPR